MTRYVILGAGAIGGVVGARLHEQGHDVVLIARGAHLDAIRDSGLLYRDPDGEKRIPIAAVGRPADIEWTGEEVVLVTLKSQHAAEAASELATAAPYSVPVVATQNGVHSEAEIARHFPASYGACVASPTSYLEAGAVAAYSLPVVGMVDFGRYPRGRDDVTAALVADFRAAGFDSRELDDLMFWKWRKLITNLTNVIEVVCGSGTRGGPLAGMVQQEAEQCLRAAGLAYATSQHDKERRGDLLQIREIAGHPRPGGSTLQSVARSAGSIETPYLNGEIARLGRQFTIPTPLNTLLVRMAEVIISAPAAAPQLTEDEFLALAELSELTGHPAQERNGDRKLGSGAGSFWRERLKI